MQSSIYWGSCSKVVHANDFGSTFIWAFCTRQKLNIIGPLQVSRQKLPKDWHKRLQAIQAKAMETVKDVPAAVLAALPGGSDAPLDYFRAVEIRDKLAASADRTLFGGLTGAAALWDKIVKAYEKACRSVCPPPICTELHAGLMQPIALQACCQESASAPGAPPPPRDAQECCSNDAVCLVLHAAAPPAHTDVYLGEASQTLLQSVDYDIPYIRKQMAKLNQQVADCDRKEGEYLKAAATCAANYKEVRARVRPCMHHACRMHAGEMGECVAYMHVCDGRARAEVRTQHAVHVGQESGCAAVLALTGILASARVSPGGAACARTAVLPHRQEVTGGSRSNGARVHGKVAFAAAEGCLQQASAPSCAFLAALGPAMGLACGRADGHLPCLL